MKYRHNRLASRFFLGLTLTTFLQQAWALPVSSIAPQQTKANAARGLRAMPPQRSIRSLHVRTTVLYTQKLAKVWRVKKKSPAKAPLTAPTQDGF
jgi:hypothetical protein